MSKRFKKDDDGTISCLKCGARSTTMPAFNYHWRKEHGDAVGNGRKKKAKKVKAKPMPVMDSADKPDVSMGFGEIRFCMHCGHEIPTGVILRGRK